MNKKRIVQTISYSVLDVFYPNNCSICSTHLNHHEKYICLNCLYDLPYIETQLSLEKIFWGRVSVEKVYSLLNYQKGNQTQKILHELKYKNKSKLAYHLGTILGEKITNEKFDQIIPVPLHPKKLQKRGYNQSTLIAKGIESVIGIQVNEKNLIRNAFNLSQTKFSKYERWDNVKQIFSVVNPEYFIKKHVLLIDDVLTTGATIEACVAELLKIKDCKVSIATLAARI